ncbi:hypothetical protein JXB41_00500 [Candidatus Woesearchaeota archaeon]|nr:hypothetical protein [Candidatus Woesearchaeota archaeon]
MANGNGYSITEQMACIIARELENDDILAIGLNAEMMLAAGFVAQKLYAPRLVINAGNRRVENKVELTPPAWCNIKNTISPFLVEKFTQHEEILTVGNQSAEEFCNVFFVGGIQIDKHGNTNLIGIRDRKSPEKFFRLRGPGSIGTTSIAGFAKKYYIFSTEHSKRRLVEKVDFVSVPGYNIRKLYGLKGGPELLITPLAVFDFPSGKARLRSYHSHTTIDEIREKTGFGFTVSKDIKKTKKPTKRELSVLKRVDKGKVLKSLDKSYVY